MVNVYLYGNLRKFAPDSRPSANSLIQVAIGPGVTVEDVLSDIGLEQNQISTIFVNSKLLATRNRMAYGLNYVQVGDDPHRWDLSLALMDGDRIGVFGRDMPALVV